MSRQRNRNLSVQYCIAGTTSWKTPSQASAKTADYGFNLKLSYDNIEVRCIVSDDSGNEVISETRKANVFAFTLQPKNVIASAGEVVNFELSAIGNNVTYQWYYKRPNSTWKKTTVAGETTAVLPIIAGTVNDGTSYRCVITDEARNKINLAAVFLTLDSETTMQVTGISLAGVVINDSVRREALTRDQMRKFLKFVYGDNCYYKYYEAFLLTGL